MKIDTENWWALLVLLTISIALLFVCVASHAGECEGSRADRHNKDFRAAAWRHWPLAEKKNWCELHARAMVESSGNPDAVSPAGAVGLMQIMPGTGRDLGVKTSDLLNARTSIHAAARLSERYRAFWHSPRTGRERRELERASYNAGPGSVLKAQKLCGMGRTWSEIRGCLPGVTGRHAQETIDYVERHDKWLLKLRN